MSNARRVADYLAHMLNAMERIARYTADMEQTDFLRSELVQDAVLRNIEILGEASNNIQRAAPEFAAQHDDIPWLVIYTMRNRVSHGYDKVDLPLVWKTVRGDLPVLQARIQGVRTSLLSR